MFWERHTARLEAALIAAVLVAGAAYAVRLGDRLRYPDEADYLAIAGHIAQQGFYSQDGVTPTAYRPPAYPLLLGLVAFAGGGIPCARLLNMAALGFSAWLVMRLARRFGGPLAALPAGAMLVLYPLNLYTAGTLYPQALAMALFLAALELAVSGAAGRRRGAAALGLVSGLLLLTVPTGLVPVAVLWGVALRPALPRGRGLRAAALLAALALVLGPWTWRNHRALGAWVPFATNGGINLLLGNAPKTTPNAGVNVDLSAYAAGARGLGEVASNAYYTRAALAAVRAAPFRAARLYALKFLNHFNFRNALYTADEGSRARDVLLALTYGALLLGAAWRCAGAWRRGGLLPFQRLCLALYLLNAAGQAVFFTRLRFRMPFDPLLILLAVSRAGRPAPSRPAQAGGTPPA